VDTVVVLDEEEDVISRLEVQELGYMQAQEETKNAVLGTDETMEEMMERKLTERFIRMEAEWEHKASIEAIKISDQAETITRQADRILQLERSVCEKATVSKGTSNKSRRYNRDIRNNTYHSNG
jgi:hypothetical protein